MGPSLVTEPSALLEVTRRRGPGRLGRWCVLRRAQDRRVPAAPGQDPGAGPCVSHDAGVGGWHRGPFGGYTPPASLGPVVDSGESRAAGALLGADRPGLSSPTEAVIRCKTGRAHAMGRLRGPVGCRLQAGAQAQGGQGKAQVPARWSGELGPPALPLAPWDPADWMRPRALHPAP